MLYLIQGHEGLEQLSQTEQGTPCTGHQSMAVSHCVYFKKYRILKTTAADRFSVDGLGNSWLHYEGDFIIAND